MSATIRSLGDLAEDRQRIPGSFSFDHNEHLASVSADGSDASIRAMAADISPAALVDLRNLEHVSPIDENLICSVCHCAFILPVMLTKCEHIFCAECFESASRQQQNICPFCRSPTDGQLRPAPRAVSNMADDLKVRCPQWADGCEAIITRGSVQSHVNKYCDYTKVHCPGERCACTVLRKDSDGMCPHKLVTCEDCRDLIVQKDLAVCSPPFD